MTNRRLSEASTAVGLASEDEEKGGRKQTMLPWLQVISAFFMNFNSWGLVNAFGAFQTYYSTHLLREHTTSSVSWVGTIEGFLLLLIGVMVGPLFDKGHARILVTIGSFLVVFGLMMTSLSSRFYQIFLAQGVALGLGAGCLFVCSVANVQLYFAPERRALATGLASTGGSVGGIVYSIAFNRLLREIGFAWATRILGFVALATALLSFALLKPHPTTTSRKSARKLVDTSAFHSVTYDMLCLGLFLLYVGLYVPFFYISIYSETVLHTSPNLAFYMVTFLNVGAIFGRIIGGYIADRFKCALLLQTGCAMSAGILALCWIATRNLPGIIVFDILYGACQGIVVAMPPAVIAGMAPEPSKIGTWIGMGISFSGLGLLVGSPIAGKLVGPDDNQFTGAQIFGGCFALAGAAAFAGVILIQRTRSREG